MKRISVFITILASLLMFQSLWNIAAAFCVHENTEHVVHTQHFGHHQVLSSCQQDPEYASKQDNRSVHAQIDLEDHADHLPSFAHIVILEHHSELMRAEQFSLVRKQNYLWSNLYQSPDLTGQNPPPLFPPLLVG
ncbi:cation efflux protein, CzcI-like [Acinetobacter populi]|uniref:Cation transporter n=1 Tax=Acinetobacter populi TaxID=1582270 RepID=A0A1Z9YVJ5_9GAMM|nr:hypothetical protein CAP51_13220 [Acinetobacter populi]